MTRAKIAPSTHSKTTNNLDLVVPLKNSKEGEPTNVEPVTTTQHLDASTSDDRPVKSTRADNARETGPVKQGALKAAISRYQWSTGQDVPAISSNRRPDTIAPRMKSFRDIQFKNNDEPTEESTSTAKKLSNRQNIERSFYQRDPG